SSFTRGCYPPCLCPIFTTEDISGTYRLAFDHQDPLFTWYRVEDVRRQLGGRAGRGGHAGHRVRDVPRGRGGGGAPADDAEAQGGQRAAAGVWQGGGPGGLVVPGDRHHGVGEGDGVL